jgi:hypothetical protein
VAEELAMQPRNYGLVAGGAAAAAVGFELVRLLVVRAPIHGFSPLFQAIVSTVFIGTLGVAAVGLALQKTFGWIDGVFAMLVALAYGFLIPTTGPHWGVLYIAVGVTIFLGLVKSMPAFRHEPSHA